MCALKSAWKCVKADLMGPNPSWPWPHSEPASMVMPTLRISSMSPGRLSQRAMRSTISSRCSIPRRQGKHFPQDSYWQNATSTRVKSTAQVSSSATMMPPEPNIAPAARISSKSMWMFRLSAPSTPPSGPPVWSSFSFLPSGTPPPISFITSPSVIPMGTSYRPGYLIWPLRQAMAVPVLRLTPMDENHSAPREIISGA